MYIFFYIFTQMPTKPCALPSETMESTNCFFLPSRSTSLTFKHSGRGLSMGKSTSAVGIPFRKVLHLPTPTLKIKITIIYYLILHILYTIISAKKIKTVCPSLFTKKGSKTACLYGCIYIACSLCGRKMQREHRSKIQLVISNLPTISHTCNSLQEKLKLLPALTLQAIKSCGTGT